MGEKSLQFNWSSNEHHEDEGHHLISLDPDHQDIHRSSYNNTPKIAKPFSTLPFCYRISIYGRCTAHDQLEVFIIALGGPNKMAEYIAFTKTIATLVLLFMGINLSR